MKNATLQFDEAMSGYLEYAAAIKRKPVQRFVATLRRRFTVLHPSLKRLYTLETFARKEILDAVQRHELQNRLPKSLTYSNRNSAAHRCWENMLANRVALSA